MARKSRKSGGSPRKSGGSFRRVKAFFVANLILWVAIGGWYLFQPPTRQQEVSRLVVNLIDARKQITAFDVVWDLWQIYYSEDYVRGLPTGDKTHVYGGAPVSVTAPARVLANTGYVVAYSDLGGHALYWDGSQICDPDPDTKNGKPINEYKVQLWVPIYKI